jgi:hypothetical protein
VKTERKSVSSAHKLDGLGKLKEHAPRSEHVHLHQDIGHIRKNALFLQRPILHCAHLSFLVLLWHVRWTYLLPFLVTMVTMGGDLQPGSLTDRLLTGLGQPQINP